MDGVPYDFVDRVFTKLTEDELSAIAVKSSIWSEVKRVYKSKIQHYNVAFRFVAGHKRFSYKITTQEGSRKQITLDEALQLDPRFHRVETFYVQEGRRTDPLIDLPVERVPELIEYVASFNLSSLLLYALVEASKSLQKRILTSDFRAQTVVVYYFPGGEEFLRQQLNNPGLEALNFCRFGRRCADLKDQFEAFVCQPNFEKLECDSECFDIADFKRIVAYWKAAKPKKEWTIRVKRKRNQNDRIALWVPPRGTAEGGSKLCDGIGIFNLLVDYDAVYCELKMELKDINELCDQRRVRTARH